MHDIIELAGGVPSLHPERKGQLNKSPLKNWIEKNGGLPTYINSVATAILRENPGWSISRVIATAVNWAKKTCATGKAFGGRVSVSAAVQSAACTAVAQWEKKKASASDDVIDEEILSLSDEESESYWLAGIRKRRRANGKEIGEALTMSDEDYFKYILKEEWDFVEGGEYDS